ncbi:MAG: HAD-IA family hydrolase [Candidatus Eisenbacteria sp.]|nr:HAD-IA family hydrolase [Candidatus Eisenbacteria bacterium]
MKAGILFDFDGTLVDTFDDIVQAVQRLRLRLNSEPLSSDEIRRHIGWGIRNLISQCHPQLDPLRPHDLPADGESLPVPSSELEHAVALFRKEYAAFLIVHTRPYPGIESLCRRLTREGHGLGIVSNKQERFTRQILARLGMVDPFAVVLGGDTLPTRKPDPEPLLHAARQLRIPRERCVMVGDSRLDIEAARAAGIHSCAVGWGLLPEEELLALGPTRFVHKPEALEPCLRELLDLKAARGG